MADKEDNEEDLEYVKQLLLLPIEELDAMLKDKIDQNVRTKATYNTLVENCKALETKLSKLDEYAENIKEPQENDKESLEHLVSNGAILYRQMNEIEKSSDNLLQEFSAIVDRLHLADKAYEDHNLLLYAHKEEVQNELNQIATKTKDSEAELTLKRESLDATIQVLESKEACLKQDKQDVLKLEKELNELSKNDCENKLIKLEKEEQSLIKTLTEQDAEIKGLTQTLGELHEDITRLTKEAEDLPQQLDMEVKNNAKLREELQKEEELLMNKLTEKAKNESNTIVQENLKIAVVLKDHLSQIAKLTEQINKKKEKMGAVEKQFDKVTAEINQVNEKVVNVKKEIAQESETKNTLEKKILEQLECISKLKIDLSALKTKINQQKTNLKRNRQIMQVDPEEMDLVFGDDSSSSSSGSSFSLSVASSFSGTRPDIADILGKLGATTSENVVSSSNDGRSSK